MSMIDTMERLKDEVENIPIQLPTCSWDGPNHYTTGIKKRSVEDFREEVLGVIDKYIKEAGND